MASEDIVFQEGDRQNFIVELVRSSSTTNQLEIVFDKNLISELPPTPLRKVRVYSAGSQSKQGSKNI